jgi:ABC-type nitrate/sulfonate/bicarbonate transport system substrate-binding protein
MLSEEMQRSLTLSRRAFCRSMGAAVGFALLPTLAHAGGQSVMAATGLDAYFVPFALAKDKQLFEGDGLALDYKPFDDGSVALDAVISGQADLGAASAAGGITRWGKGGRLYVVSTLDWSGTLHGLVVRDSIRNAEDLIGKTIAFPKYSGGHYFFFKYAVKHGLPIERIKVKTVAAPETVAALARGDIDGFFLWEPWPTKAIELVKDAHMLAWGKDEGLNFVDYIYFSERLLEDSDRATAVLRAMIRATDYCAKDPEAAAASAAKAFRLSLPEARGYVSKLTFRAELPREKTMADLDDWAKFCMEVGLLKQPPDFKNFVQQHVMQRAAPDRASGWQ